MNEKSSLLLLALCLLNYVIYTICLFIYVMLRNSYLYWAAITLLQPFLYNLQSAGSVL